MAKPKPPEKERIQVHCNYMFSFEQEGAGACRISLGYTILYSLTDSEPTDPDDLWHFANANGRYHTWPFAREMVNSLTAKTGYTPYVLPALSFSPKAKNDDEETEEPIPEEEELKEVNENSG